jgi:cysteine desulfurase
VIYADANAGLPPCAAALAAYAQAAQYFANPSSAHAAGRRARAFYDDTRQALRGKLGLPGHKLTLLSGATEANAWVLLKFVRPGDVVATSALEHASVLQNLGHAHVHLVPLDRRGGVDVEALLAVDARLIVLSAAASETGILQPVGELCAKSATPVLCDATQVLGRSALPPATFVSFSGHKIGAVPGIGGLLHTIDLEPMLAGGGQEGGQRAGTENVAGAASLLAALGALQPHSAALRDHLEAHFEAPFRGTPRLGNTATLRLPGVRADAAIMALDEDDIAVSAGSACRSGALDPSPALLAMGFSALEAEQMLRVSFAPDIDMDQVGTLIRRLQEVRAE